MYLTILNENSSAIRVRISDTETLNIRAKSSVSAGINPKFYKQLKQDPKVKLYKCPPYDYFKKILVENKGLKNEIKRLGQELKELKELKSKGIVIPNTVEGLSHLLNIKLDKTDNDLKMAIFQKIIDENIRIRTGE